MQNESRAIFAISVAAVARGRGVVANRAFERGETIVVFEPRFENAAHRYTIQVDAQRHLATGDSPGAFVNHSCGPNAKFDADALAFVAVRSIAAGEEVTYNYLSTEWQLSEPFECSCGATPCFGSIRGYRYASPAARQQIEALIVPYLREPPAHTGPAPFNPSAYLTEYFTETDVEYEGLYRFWVNAVRRLAPGLRALEMGVGPALYSAIPLAERFDEIWLSDFVPESLVEIRKWLESQPGAFDWSTHIRLVLQTEGKSGTKEEIEQRSRQLRRAVKNVLRCDLRDPMPLGHRDDFDLVTAHYCTEAATTSAEEWTGVIGNVASLIAPGGWGLFSVSTGLTIYRTYDPAVTAKPSPNVTRDLLFAGLEKAGFHLDSATVELLPAPASRPYTGTFLVFAKKG